MRRTQLSDTERFSYNTFTNFKESTPIFTLNSKTGEITVAKGFCALSKNCSVITEKKESRSLNILVALLADKTK